MAEYIKRYRSAQSEGFERTSEAETAEGESRGVGPLCLRGHMRSPGSAGQRLVSPSCQKTVKSISLSTTLGPRGIVLARRVFSSRGEVGQAVTTIRSTLLRTWATSERHRHNRVRISGGYSSEDRFGFPGPRWAER